MPNRDDEKLWVTAPYAVAVHEGKNVTADPPRTQLWALLYAQVKQADNRDFRNILLDDRRLDWRVQVETEKEKETPILVRHTDEELELLRRIAFENFEFEINPVATTNQLKLVDFSTKNKDATRYGTVIWSNQEVLQLLENLGLPLASPLSVLVVEILPQITNLLEHVSRLDKERNARAAESLVGDEARGVLRERIRTTARSQPVAATFKSRSPLSDELGHHRILRTSPLAEVPEICPPK